MPPFPDGTATAFARSVSAEIRAVMAARRITGRELALAAGFKSHNYLAIRLRDEKAFTLDDIELICAYLEEDAHELIRRAHENHMDRLMAEEARANPAEVDLFYMGDDGSMHFVDAKVATESDRRHAVAQLRHYPARDWVITNSRGEEISHHDTEAEAIRAARELIRTSAGVVSGLPTLGQKRAAKRTYAQPVQEAARPTGKKARSEDT
ncbi:hypothetical protein ASE01_19930 [Nocardioides sp. Root190]|uniref:helix-turn-helix domain-containing protein n=1 Tax=Nocardioides sp. Root190 TaxID=1736488 RepID=UPI0006F2C070|nr:helix-turn-helix transcriptional regulator [Nocardioides sp. Root190]KRB73047.1 hypothetical protein ASE01_19930 [Nocardioides sp. Root190]